MGVVIETGRLKIVPFEMGRLEEYVSAFDGEITKYQYPDPFASVAAAQETLQGFMDLMHRNEMLFLSILTPDGGFVGGVEVHGIREEYPELGIWIKKGEQQKGYAWEALAGVLKFVDGSYRKEWYVFEADIRNAGSMKLAEKFDYRKEGLDEFETETGKLLRLQRFLIRSRR
ncbi:MAG: GNAT family N-acetyltransferase [Oscillospiraceae bacterium]|jgi:RimJ/RimL family protein N-acetyltransferase|nr:GNAT family N-acetyltransferase [Oscillospiraceae bacterium]